MAGEWIPIDCNLGTKPEVLEVAAATDQPVEVVVGRLVRLWSWAWFITADGTFRGSLAMLPSVAGGDEPFWQAVEQAGWLVAADRTLTIPGWEERFSQSAKSRALAARRQDSWRKRQSNAGRNGAALPEERRGEEKREEENTTTAAPSSRTEPQAVRPATKVGKVGWDASQGWSGITAEDRSEWAAAYPGAVLDTELAKATAWLKANPQRCGRRNWRRFIVNWLSRCQDKGGTNRTPGVQPRHVETPEAKAANERKEQERRRREAEYLAGKERKRAMAIAEGRA
jgi:hypothetical protein